MTALSLRSLTKSYGGLRALDGAGFDIAGPGIYGLIGPNGAGKTTLFDTIAGNITPDSGSIWLQGHDITGLPSHRIAALGVARTFQECRVLLDETCLDNLLFAAQPKGLAASIGQMLSRSKRHRQEFMDEAIRLLTMVRLQDYADAKASELSFGQRRLLEIVSTFISTPTVFLLDEPASGVNPSLLQVLGDFIRAMYAEQPRVFLLVEHNMEFVMSIAQDIVVMQQGRVLERGTPEQIQNSARVVEAYLG